MTPQQVIALKVMQSLVESSPRIKVLQKEFVINTEVFHPHVCDCKMVEFVNEQMLEIIKEEIAISKTTFDFLEVGSGAGYTSILTALASETCRVWATDINEAAVKNTLENAKFHGVESRVKAVVADVFDNKEIKERKFDMIYWNIPWNGEFVDPKTKVNCPLLSSLLDPGNRSLRRYLSEAHELLKPKGRLFLVFSFYFLSGHEKLFRSIASESGWKYKVYSSEIIHFEEGQEEFDVSIVELFKNN